MCQALAPAVNMQLFLRGPADVRHRLGPHTPPARSPPGTSGGVLPTRPLRSDRHHLQRLLARAGHAESWGPARFSPGTSPDRWRRPCRRRQTPRSLSWLTPAWPRWPERLLDRTARLRIRAVSASTVAAGPCLPSGSAPPFSPSPGSDELRSREAEGSEEAAPRRHQTRAAALGTARGVRGPARHSGQGRPPAPEDRPWRDQDAQQGLAAQGAVLRPPPERRPSGNERRLKRRGSRRWTASSGCGVPGPPRGGRLLLSFEEYRSYKYTEEEVGLDALVKRGLWPPKPEGARAEGQEKDTFEEERLTSVLRR